MKLSMHRTIRIGVGAISLACIVLAGITVVPNFVRYRGYVAAIDQFESFTIALRLAREVSAERGPANSLMSIGAVRTDKVAEALSERRRQADGLLTELERHFAVEIDTSDALRQVVSAYRLQHATGRAAVDALIAKEPDRRSAADVYGAIDEMFLAADRAQDLRDVFGRAVMERSPQLGIELVMATLTSDLREYAGRIGSYVVAAINFEGRDPGGIANAFNGKISMVDMLRRQVQNHASPYFSDPAVDAAIRDVGTLYFDGSLDYARNVFQGLPGNGLLTPRAFTDAYVPGMRATETLRDVILEAGHNKLVALRSRALLIVIGSASLALVGICLAILSLVAFSRTIFQPLMKAGDRITRISRGDLTPTHEPPSSAVEVQHLFRNIDQLREQQISRRRLEEERAELARELKILSSTDPLTGLMNRRAFHETIEAHLRLHERTLHGFGVVMVDLDHFKAINDTYGHAVGDEVLKRSAALLAGCLRGSDVIARFGGEEFVILLRGVEERDLATAAEGIRTLLADAVLLRSPDLRVTASFGVAWCPPGVAMVFDDVMRIADERLYEAKRAGRNRVCMGSGVAARPSREPKALRA